MLIRISIPIMYLCRSLRRRVRPRRGPAERRTRRRCLFFDDFLVVSVVNVDFALLLPLSLLFYVFFSSFLGCLRSYNCCVDINLWSVLFQTTPFVNSPINQSSSITNPTLHPFLLPPAVILYRKTGFLYLKRRYFRIFDGFLAVVKSNINRF